MRLTAQACTWVAPACGSRCASGETHVRCRTVLPPLCGYWVATPPIRPPTRGPHPDRGLVSASPSRHP
eukprot:6186968-Pleurochrysis_carterae.AAC.3